MKIHHLRTKDFFWHMLSPVYSACYYRTRYYYTRFYTYVTGSFLCYGDEFYVPTRLLRYLTK